MKKAALSIIIGLLLGSAGFAVGIMVGSNRESGTVVVNSSLLLSGALPTSYDVGSTTVTTETIQNTMNVPLSVYLELTLSSSGISSSSAAVTIAGNPIVPSCSSDTCVYDGASWTIQPGATSPCDIGITFNQSGTFGYVLQAWGS